MIYRPAAALLLAATAVLVPAPAHAAACSSSSGVTVVVQFTDDPASIRTGCATGSPANGIEALDAAGFDWSPVPGQGGGAVCRIDGYPGAGEPCWQPPDYWAYFYAEPGGTWTYSQTGAGGRTPKPGTVEGWRFRGSSSKPPALTPPAPPKPAPKPSAGPTSGPTAQPDTGQPARPSTTSTGAPAQPSDVAAPGPGSGTGKATGSPGPSGSPSADDSAAAGASAAVSPAAAVAAADEPFARTADETTGLSWMWGLALVLVVGVAGGLTAVRRRRT